MWCFFAWKPVWNQSSYKSTCLTGHLPSVSSTPWTCALGPVWSAHLIHGISPHIYRQSFDSLTRPQQQIEPYPTTSCHFIIISAARLGRAQNKSSHITVSYEPLPTMFSGYVFVCKSLTRIASMRQLSNTCTAVDYKTPVFYWNSNSCAWCLQHQGHGFNSQENVLLCLETNINSFE